MVDNTAPKAHTMLLGFQAENVRSFRDPIEFSLEATTMAEPDVVREIPWRIEGRTLTRVLPAAGVFGANASGKTNLLRALDDMRRFVRDSYSPEIRRSEHPFERLRKPFQLDPRRAKQPSTYEIDLIIDGVRYEYGFQVDDDRVLREWARRYPRGKAATIFEREPGVMISFADRHSKKGRAIQEFVRDDTLLLSVAETAGYEQLRPLYKWFGCNFKLCDASSREARSVLTARLMATEDRRRQVLALLQVADLGITDARRQEAEPHELELLHKLVRAINTVEEVSDGQSQSDKSMQVQLEGIPSKIKLTHRGRQGDVEFEPQQESLGTMIWLGLVGPLLEALIDGTVLLVDELEASLHPLLVEQFVRLFQSPESNPNNAQLIFNSHEARLLGNTALDRVLGRDQAWFTEKLDDGSTHLYSLADLDPRKSEAIAKRYLDGRYGATPILSASEFTALASMLAADDAAHRDSEAS
jgi:predicted ATPase